YPAWPAMAAIRDAMRDGTGDFSGVPTARDDYHADVAVMFIDGTRVDGPCGVAYTLPDIGGGDDDSKYDVALSTECAVGDRTFTHEIGHIMAGMHDTTMGSHPGYPVHNNHGYSSASPAFAAYLNDMKHYCRKADCRA
ncbi:MAG TPA: zinc-dependent metalloprotease family protein, partial [Rhodanobacteraceae bacterium]|nr:zinc-dependent metalloprotease family protein [Rhodanobacteraceae bacterium]